MSNSRVVRTIILAFAVAFGIISVGFGLNTLVKSNQQKSYIKRSVPAGVTIFINTNDALRSGIVVAVASVVVAILAAISLIYDLVPKFRPYHAPKTYRILSYAVFFVTAAILSSLIALDFIARTRSAKIKAFQGDVPLPAEVIAATAAQLGVSAAYWSNDFIHWMAIVPWFAFLFGLLSGIELFRASNAESELAPAKTHTRFVQDAPSASLPKTSLEKDEKSDTEDEKVRDGDEQV